MEDIVKSGGSQGENGGPNSGPLIQATLVIRVWRDTESPEPFRARIIAGSAESDERTTSYARDRAEVITAVNRWLNNLPDV
ncbi:hypothetical protein SRABI26_03695 [Arthrobacter sp. Bi26]|nr:hypothetical protein SRABI26_03695 [Arthrobacter sp. Bi26]